jgi:hypothetical protein
LANAASKKKISTHVSSSLMYNATSPCGNTNSKCPTASVTAAWTLPSDLCPVLLRSKNNLIVLVNTAGVGDCVGGFLLVGALVGDFVGALVGDLVGGALVGADVGGASVVNAFEISVGANVGTCVGANVGMYVDDPVGRSVGRLEGRSVGLSVGGFLGYLGGELVTHTLFRQLPPEQSSEFKWACPILRGQDPPQSTSVSSLPLRKLWQKAKEGASVGDAFSAGVDDFEGPSVVSLFVGSVVGLPVGCTVAGGLVDNSVGVKASVALENHSE